jgi:hypothetical protein
MVVQIHPRQRPAGLWATSAHPERQYGFPGQGALSADPMIPRLIETPISSVKFRARIRDYLITVQPVLLFTSESELLRDDHYAV